MPETPPTPSDSIRRLLLSVPNRRRIYETIKGTPGTHLRQLSRDLGLAIGSVEHHLRQLVRYGLLFSHQDGRRRTYYVRGDVTPSDAAILHALRKPLWSEILLTLTLRKEESVTAIAQRLDIPTNSLSYHLRKLRDMGLLECLQVGRESLYTPCDPDRILRLHAGLHVPDAEIPDFDDAFKAVVDRARKNHEDGRLVRPRADLDMEGLGDAPMTVRDAQDSVPTR